MLGKFLNQRYYVEEFPTISTWLLDYQMFFKSQNYIFRWVDKFQKVDK
jgi:hypothetical protein